ncbi:MAG: septal ring lytic transglycosylase RlpA family protein, partial [Pseudomonadota bacterium]
MLSNSRDRRLLGTLASLSMLVLLAACAGTPQPNQQTAATPPKGGIGHYKLGSPYKVDGRWYTPRYERVYRQEGIASWYGEPFHGRLTANGEVFDRHSISAAHPTLPLPSVVKVTNLENGRWLELRVNDRGPFVGDRMIDLSQAAARELGFENAGLAKVRVEFIKLA